MPWPSTILDGKVYGPKSLCGVFALCRAGHRVEGDVVRIVDEDEIIELEMPGAASAETPSCKQPSPARQMM